VERWSGGAVERWSGGAVERWSGGAVERWSGGAVERWSGKLKTCFIFVRCLEMKNKNDYSSRLTRTSKLSTKLLQVRVLIEAIKSSAFVKTQT
jgi:hypothetical protein